MRSIVYYGLEYLMCTIEVFILYTIFSRLFEKKIKKVYAQVGLMLSMSIVILLKDIFLQNLGIGIVYTLAMILLYSHLQFKVALKESIAYLGFYILCTYLCDLTIAELYCFFNKEATVDYVREVYELRYPIAIGSKLCCLTILGILTSKNIVFSRGEKEGSKIGATVLIATATMSIMSLYGLQKIIQYSLGWTTNPQIDLMICVVSISIFLINIIVYWAIRLVNVSIEKEKEYELIQYQNEVLIKSTEENQAVENEWHRIRHDFNNHISCIDMLLQMKDVEKARGYIQKLTKLTETQTVHTHVGNTVADAVINQKLLRARQYNIEMIIEGKIPAGLQIEDIDLCALMSNALDNAIEAACQIEDIHQRKIEIRIVEKAQNVWIEISNTVKEDIEAKKTLVTTKKDVKRHGIGMRSMSITIKKYKGHLSWSCQEKVFTLNMVLPN